MKTSLYITSFCLFAFINPFFSQQISTLDGRFLSQNGELLEGSFETFYETGQLHESFQMINGINKVILFLIMPIKERRRGVLPSRT